MTIDESVEAIVTKALLKERWRIADAVDQFWIDQNPIDTDDYYGHCTYAVTNWDNGITALANRIRGLPELPYNFPIKLLHIGDMIVTYECTKCNKYFVANFLTKENYKEDNYPVCPSRKCGEK